MRSGWYNNWVILILSANYIFVHLSSNYFNRHWCTVQTWRYSDYFHKQHNRLVFNTERQWALCELHHIIRGSNDNRVAEEARLSRKWFISSSFKREPSNRLLKFVASVGATDNLRCKRLFAQTLYFPLSASYEDNIFTSLPSLKRGSSESFYTYSLDISLIYSLRFDGLRYYVYICSSSLPPLALLHRPPRTPSP